MGNAVMENPPRQASPATPQEGNSVADMIYDRLLAFDKAIEDSDLLEIDGTCIDNQPVETHGGAYPQHERIKVVNHKFEAAVEIEIGAILTTPLADLILALETFEFTKLHGITRIVGYYSRINNWNRSKVQELQDRHKGAYSVTGA